MPSLPDPIPADQPPAAIRRQTRHGFRSIRGAAEFLGLGTTKVRELIDAGTFSTCMVFGRVMIPTRELQDWCARQMAQHGNQRGQRPPLPKRLRARE